MKTGIIIQARMGSGRLPGKAMMKIQDCPSFTWCLEQCKRMNGIDEIITATTYNREDRIFDQMGIDVFHGSRDDLIIRYFGAAREYGIDTVIRVSGDSPLFSHEIGDILLTSHLETGADYTEATRHAVGTSCQVWQAETFEKLLKMGVDWKYSEHMSYFVASNPDMFQVNRVDLPLKFVRNYRLTLDYQDDLDMLNPLFSGMIESGGSIYRVGDVITYLDRHPEIAKINDHCRQAFDSQDLRAELKRENERIRSDYGKAKM